MRRFVDTFAGKAFCHLAVMALVLPTVTLTVARRAEAQVQQLPSWAVTEFKDMKGNASLKYGQAAADAVSKELATTKPVRRGPSGEREALDRDPRTDVAARPVGEP